MRLKSVSNMARAEPRDSRARYLRPNHVSVVALAVSLVLLVGPASQTLAAHSESQAVRVLIVKMTWGPQPFASTDVDSVMGTVVPFYLSSSYGNVSIAYDQTPWLMKLQSQPPCSTLTELDSLISEMTSFSSAAGYDPTQYNKVIFLLPRFSCSFVGIYRPGGIVLNGVLTQGLVIHELGHSFGMAHAGAFVCRYEASKRFCTAGSYGDPWDVMAPGGDTTDAAGPIGDFGALQKARAGWLKSYAYLGKAGTYRVGQLEATSPVPQALIIDVAGFEYWVDHREAAANDSYLASNERLGDVTKGFEVHRVSGDPLITPSGVFASDYLMPHGPANLYYYPPDSTFVVPGEFDLQALSRSAGNVTVRFAWLDHSPPSTPRLTIQAPSSPTGVTSVRWARSADKGTGVKAYQVTLDSRVVATISASSKRPTFEYLVTNLSSGQHRVTVVAVDYAGNASHAGSRTFDVPR